MALFGKDICEKLETLIKIPSTTPPGDVRGVVDLLLDFAEETGARFKLQEVQPGKENCLLYYDFAPGPTLAFNTHMDVNNPNGQTWSFDPFKPFIKDDRLYGLGACDAKGSLAALLTAIENLIKKPDGLTGSLVLTAVMGEEAGGLGSLHLAQSGFKADAALVGEPTELRICTAHKGTYMRKIRFLGKAAHSASSRKGINAITHAAYFCGLYEELSKRLEDHPHPVLGMADASVTLIQGGTRQNTIPAYCEVVIDRRLLPGEDSVQADRELAALLDAVKERYPEANWADIEVLVSTIPSATPTESSIVQTALQILKGIKGVDARPEGFQAGCDMSKLNVLCGIPTIIFGPGSLNNAHSPDEMVPIDELNTAAVFYEKLARAILSEV